MRPVALFLLALAVLAACGRESRTDGSSPPAAGVPAKPLSVEEALGSELDEPLLVEGAVYARSGEPVRLCSGFAESYPPQCVDPSLVVEGLDLDDVEGVQRASGVAWAERPVRILGRVDDGVLTVSTTSKA